MPVKELYDQRCRDAARIVAGSPKTKREVGAAIRRYYTRMNPSGTWIRDVLLDWNPMMSKMGSRYTLTSLGRALVGLPGREGEPLTNEEKAFILGVMMLDTRQRRIICELLAKGATRDRDKWIVDQTKKVLAAVGVLSTS